MKPQWREALERSQDTRTARGRLRRQLRAGDVHVAAVLLTPPSFVQTMQVQRLLAAAPGLGDSKVSKVLMRHGLTALDQVGAVDRETRGAIVSFMASEFPWLWKSWAQRCREKAAA